MTVLSIIHQADAGSGVFAEATAHAGRPLEEVNPAAGQAPAQSLAEYEAVLTFGGSANPDQDAEHPWLQTERELLREVLAASVPVLAVCLGAQLLAQAAGGGAPRAATPEIGWHDVRLTPEGRHDPVLGRLPARFRAFQWHSYWCEPPAAAAVLADGEQGVQAFRVGAHAWGLQFHAEVTGESISEWIREHPPDGAARGFDPEALAAETERRIEPWNALGRELCGAFLGVTGRLR